MKNTGSMSISEKGNMEKLDVEEQSRKIPYPKGVFFLMATELSERFSYYGMRAVLTIYMRNVLNFSENTATSYYHIFLLLCYGLPIVWGVISDSWLGKFKTILYVSILFALGNVVLTLSSVPPLHLPSKAFFFVGLFLMAIGTGGMKPCVAPLGGEQFVMPEQSKQLSQFFSAFFFAVTIGNMISTIITPIFRRDVSCFSSENCYPLAFGVPSGIMLVAIVTFVCGRPLYKVNKPKGNMLVKVTKCVAHAISNRGKKSVEENTHWLDKASDLFDNQIIKDTKGLFRVLPYFIPVPMFFALYEQLGSRWTLQATRMKGTIGSFSIKPDQMQVSNAILMFISLPLFNWVVYPVVAKFGINFRTLAKMVVGGLLAAMSFGVAGLVELKIEPAIKARPHKEHSVLTLANFVPCPVQVWIHTDTFTTYEVAQNSFITLPELKFTNETNLKVGTHDASCPLNSTWEGQVRLLPREYQTVNMLMLPDGSLSVDAFPFADDYSKSKDGNARIKFVIEQDNHVDVKLEDLENITITLTSTKEGPTHSFDLLQKDNLFYSETEEVDEDVYKVTLKSSNGNGVIDISKELELLNGGSYNLIVVRNSANNKLQSQLVVITPPNDVHILWLIPQYVLMAWGEILFIVSGMEFAYTEAPPSMKSVVQAIWHLMNACGNLIVIIAAQNHGQGSQAIEFFIFAGCMFIDSIVYGFMARRYKYVTHDAAPVVMH